MTSDHTPDQPTPAGSATKGDEWQERGVDIVHAAASLINAFGAVEREIDALRMRVDALESHHIAAASEPGGGGTE